MKFVVAVIKVLIYTSDHNMKGSMMHTTDEATGIKREVVPAYSQSNSLPGATVVPANSGRFGGQVGVKIDDPLPMVINPDSSNPITLLTTDVAKYMPEALKQSAGDHNAAYLLVSEWSKKAKSETENAAPKTDLNQEGVTKTRTRAKKQASVAAANPTAGSAPTPKTAFARMNEMEDENLGNDQKFDEMSKMNDMVAAAAKSGLYPTQQAPDMMTLLGKMMADYLVRAETVTKQTPQVHVENSSDPSVQDTSDMISGMPIPRVQVSIEGKDGSRWTCAYHEVLAQDIQLVLVYDSRFTLGGRVFPPVNCERAYRVTITPRSGKPEVFQALYTGVTFTHGFNEYQVLTVGPGAADLEDARPQQVAQVRQQEDRNPLLDDPMMDDRYKMQDPDQDFRR